MTAVSVVATGESYDRIDQKTKVYIRGRDVSSRGSVWHEVDLGEDYECHEMKARRLEWVDPEDNDEGKVNFVAVSVRSFIYLLGGQTPSTVPRRRFYYHDDVFCFDATNSLHGKNDLQVASRMNGGHPTLFRDVLVHERKIYLFNEGEFLDTTNSDHITSPLPLWEPFRGPDVDPDLRKVLGSFSDPKRDRILVCFNCNYHSPLYELHPSDNSWTCLIPNLKPPYHNLILSVLVDNVIFVKPPGFGEFVYYDLDRYKWNIVKWADGINFDNRLFQNQEKLGYWSSLLYLGDHTLLMARTHMPRRDEMMELQCLTFKFQKKEADGTFLAHSPVVKSTLKLKGAYRVDDYILL